ncbi:hypothetical protein GGI35DRAFT_484766 [Trichoderma velutinum]
MKFCQILPSVAALAALASASPIQKASDEELLARGPPASGCYPAASPRCCVPTICQCANGWIYQFNPDNQNAGGNGCDPPWGYLGQSMGQFPGYCC